MSLVKITYNLPKEIEERYPNVTLATGFLDENEWPDVEDNSLFKDLELGNYSEIENLVVSILKYIVYLIDERITYYQTCICTRFRNISPQSS